MASTTTERLKFNKPLGTFPVLQYLRPEQLQIDESYQRSIDNPKSQGLIRRIAQFWSWDRCLPLVVSRRQSGEKLIYAGSIYPGIFAVCLAEQGPADAKMAPARFARLQAMLGQKGQQHWRGAMLRVRINFPALNFPKASAKAIGDAWDRLNAAPDAAPIRTTPVSPIAPRAPVAGQFRPGLFKLTDRAWCDQCDMMVSKGAAEKCKSQHCSLKVKAA